jgi:hypothetical protein
VVAGGCGPAEQSSNHVAKTQRAVHQPRGPVNGDYHPPWIDGAETHHPIVQFTTFGLDAEWHPCSATFITPYHALTAKHCLRHTLPDLSVEEAQLTVGFTDPYGGHRLAEEVDCDPTTFVCSTFHSYHVEWVWLHPRYDLALLQVAKPYEGATMPIRWDAPAERREIPDWYYSTVIRFAGYGLWPQPGGGVLKGLRAHGKALLGPRTSYRGPTMHLGPNPSSGCEGDSGGPVYVLRGARHRSGYHSPESYSMGIASLIGVLATGTCTDDEGSGMAYLDKHWIDERICGQGWELLHGAYQLEDAVSRVRLLKIGGSTGPAVIPGSEPRSDLPEGLERAPQRDKGIVCALKMERSWAGADQGFPVDNDVVVEGIAMAYRGDSSASLLFWNPLDGPEHAETIEASQLPLRLAASGSNLFAAAYGAEAHLAKSYDLNATSCPMRLSSIVGGTTGVEQCVDAQSASSSATVGLYPAGFASWPILDEDAGSYGLDRSTPQGYTDYTFEILRGASGGQGHDVRFVDYASGYLWGYYLDEAGDVWWGTTGSVDGQFASDPDLKAIAASQVAGGTQALFGLREIGSGSLREVVRIDDSGNITRMTQPTPTPTNPPAPPAPPIGQIEQIVGRPSSGTDGLIFVRDDVNRIYRGVCSTTTEACAWGQVGEGELIRGDWSPGLQPQWP